MVEGAGASPLTEAGVEFVFDLLRIPFDASDRLWFFSDWVSCAPRSFDERLWDHCMSHGVHPVLSRRPRATMALPAQRLVF